MTAVCLGTEQNVAHPLVSQNYLFTIAQEIVKNKLKFVKQNLIKRPLRDACLCMGDLQAPPAPHFVFLITL